MSETEVMGDARMRFCLCLRLGRLWEEVGVYEEEVLVLVLGPMDVRVGRAVAVGVGVEVMFRATS